MKILKISFAALIAVATLGLTLTSQAGIFAKNLASAAIPNNCYREVTVTQGGVPTVYDASAINTLTPQCISAPTIPSHPVSGPSASNTLGSLSTLTVTAGQTAVNVAEQCEAEFDPFCCFEVVSDRVTGICFGVYTN